MIPILPKAELEKPSISIRLQRSMHARSMTLTEQGSFTGVINQSLMGNDKWCNGTTTTWPHKLVGLLIDLAVLSILNSLLIYIYCFC